MRSALLELFRHKTWATLVLLEPRQSASGLEDPCIDVGSYADATKKVEHVSVIRQ